MHAENTYVADLHAAPLTLFKTENHQKLEPDLVQLPRVSLERGTKTGFPAPMSQLSETHLVASVSMESRYCTALVSKTVKNPSSRKR